MAHNFEFLISFHECQRGMVREGKKLNLASMSDLKINYVSQKASEWKKKRQLEERCHFYFSNRDCHYMIVFGTKMQEKKKEENILMQK